MSSTGRRSPTTARGVNRLFAGALLLVTMAVVIIAALFWLIRHENGPVESTKPVAHRARSSHPMPIADASWREENEAAHNNADASDRRYSRLHHAEQAAMALAKIRGSAELHSFEQDLATFDATCAAVEAQLAEDLDAKQRHELKARLVTDFSILSEHDVRHESDAAQRLAAMERAFQRMQALIVAGDLHREPDTVSPRIVAPGKKMPSP